MGLDKEFHDVELHSEYSYMIELLLSDLTLGSDGGRLPSLPIHVEKQLFLQEIDDWKNRTCVFRKLDGRPW